MNNSAKKICVCALATAMVTVCTMVISIPISAQGYINIGDAAILLIGYFLGAKYGAIAGGVGSMLSDVLLGYGYFAPFTLIIKGLMGFIIGYWGNNSKNSKKTSLQKVSLAIISEAVMVIGYYVASSILTFNLTSALASVPMNILQGIVSAILFLVLSRYVKKINFANLIA